MHTISYSCLKIIILSLPELYHSTIGSYVNCSSNYETHLRSKYCSIVFTMELWNNTHLNICTKYSHII